MEKSTVVDLIDELVKASQDYYVNGEDSSLTDSEFDAKQAILESVAEDFPELFEDGSPGASILENGDVLLGASFSATDDGVVAHSAPMLSLAKAKKKEDLFAFLAKARSLGAEDFRLQAKLDGIAVSVKYNLGHIVSMATRGNGSVGEDITYLLNDKNLKIVNIPTVIDDIREVEVRGELFFTDEQFDNVVKNRLAYDGFRFEQSRNAAAGIVKKSKKSGVPYKVTITFGVYSVSIEGNPAELDDAPTEKGLHGFVTVDHLTRKEVGKAKLTGFADDEDLYDAIARFGELREGFTIPTDGVVVKPVNESEMIKIMGNTSHHPASQIAWKYPSEQVQTVIHNIVATVGKTGRITPVAEFDPVYLDGSIVARASLHNFALLYEKDVRVGSAVIVEKANEIIPQVVSVISSPKDSERFPVPEFCPSCGKVPHSDDDMWPPRTLTCTNALCPSRSFESLVFAVGRDYLDIDRMSRATLSELHQSGILTSIADLYELDEKVLAVTTTKGADSSDSGRVLGEKTAKHIMEHIEKSKSLPLDRILASFSIPTVGRRASKEIVKVFKNIDNILAASVADFEAIDKFGRSKAENLFNGIQARKNMIAKMRKSGVLFGEVTTETSSDSGTKALSPVFEGLSFSISGAVPVEFSNRNALVDYIESHGGAFHSAPKAATSFMIGSSSDSSSKIKKALSLGVEIISPEEFSERFMKN